MRRVTVFDTSQISEIVSSNRLLYMLCYMLSCTNVNIQNSHFLPPLHLSHKSYLCQVINCDSIVRITTPTPTPKPKQCPGIRFVDAYRRLFSGVRPTTHYKTIPQSVEFDDCGYPCSSARPTYALNRVMLALRFVSFNRHIRGT